MRSDSDSECEYILRVENHLEKRGNERNTADVRRCLRNYAEYLKADRTTRALRQAHQHSMKNWTMQIAQLNAAIARAEGKPAPNADLANAIAQPHAHKRLLNFAASLYGKSIEALQRDLLETMRTRDRAVVEFDHLLQDLLGQARPPDATEMVHIRGVLAQRRAEKVARRTANGGGDKAAPVGPKGDAMGLMKRTENSVFTSFFEKHRSSQFSELRTSEQRELKGILSQADVNQSGYLEEDDFSKLLRRLLCDHGVTQAEIDRIAMQCKLSTADGFALDLEGFHELGCQLLPVVEGVADRFIIAEDESNEELRRRQVKAAQDEKELFRIEQGAIRAIQVIRTDTKLNPAQQQELIVQELMALERARLEWAESATVLTLAELNRIRVQQLTSKAAVEDVKEGSLLVSPRGGKGNKTWNPRAPPLAGSLPSPTTNKDENEAAGTTTASQPSTSKPAARSGVTSAGSTRSVVTASGSSSKVPPTPAAALDAFKRSLRNALNRAPLVEIRSAEDIPSERVAHDLYMLFTVFSRQEEFITVEHVHHLLNLFTPCGADLDEARQFLIDECDGNDTLVFDEFIKYGVCFKTRLLAFEMFHALGSNKLKREAIQQRIDTVMEKRGRRNARQPQLRRYENEFMREEHARQALAEIRLKRQAEAAKSPMRQTRPDGKSVGGIVSSATQPAARVEAESLDWRSPRAGQSSDSPGAAAQETVCTAIALSSSDALDSDSPRVSSRKGPTAPKQPESQRRVASARNREVPLPRLLPEKQLPILSYSEPVVSAPDLTDHRKRQDDALVIHLRRAVFQR